jgi:hypothetical protein
MEIADCAERSWAWVRQARQALPDNWWLGSPG